MGNFIKSTSNATLKTRKTRADDGVEAETLSRLRSQKVTGVTPAELKEKDDGPVLRSKKRKLGTLSDEAKENGRITRSRGKIACTSDKNHIDAEISSSAKGDLTLKQQIKSQQNTPPETEKDLSRPRTRSKLTSETTITSPIRFRPSVGEWKGPALTAHVDTQHAHQSLFLRDMDLSYTLEGATEAKQLHFSFKILDNLPDDNIVYRLSATELLDDYEDLANRNELIEKVNFGDTIESALSAIQRKLKQLDEYDAMEDLDVEEERREYKRSLKSLAALRESECLVRFREMEQDRETHMRQLSMGMQVAVSPMQIEVLELCDRKIWWVGRKEWFKGSERSCMFGAKCALCLRNRKPKKSDNSRAPVAFKMPRVSAFNPKDHDDPEINSQDSKKSDDVRRYNIRSIEMQKKASITRLALHRLQASVSFVDQYNRTGKHFLPE